MNFDKTLFAKTNLPWNDGHFNSQHVVGAMMGFVKSDDFQTVTEFKESYFESGKERERIIADKFRNYPINLNEPNEIRNAVLCKSKYLTKEVFELNNNYGRTPEFIRKVAEDFATQQKLSFEIAMLHVERRLFNQTYAGQHAENVELAKLRNTYKNITFRKATPYEDSFYAVDLIGEVDGKIVIGVQVKPIKYLLNKKFQHEENQIKNNKFENDYQVKVAYLYYLQNEDTLDIIAEIMSHADEDLLEKIDVNV